MKKITTVLVGTAAACALMLSGCTSTKVSDATKDQQDQQAAWESYSRALEERDVRAEKVPDSDAPQVYMVTVYTVKADGSGLKGIVDDVENKTGEALFAKLKEYGVVPEGAMLTAYTEKDGEASVEITGTGELSQLQIQAIADTYEESFSLSKLTVAADGNTIISETYEATNNAGPGVQ